MFPINNKMISGEIDIEVNSINVYNESDQPNPIGHYARSKYLGEKYVIENSDSIKNIQAAARETAEKNCYSAQIPIWKKFMEGFTFKLTLT